MSIYRKKSRAIAFLLVFFAFATSTAIANDLMAIRGVVRAEATATLSSELVAKIEQLPLKPGQSFKKGDVLVAFDCRRYEADLRAAKAEVKALKVTADQSRQLLKYRAGGASDAAIAEAKLEQARATVDGLNVRLSQCMIKAPFDGRIAERLAQVYELPQANAPLLKIVKDGELELELIVPSNWMTWLKPGQKFSFLIDETGTSHEAQIVHLGAVVDPISRTMKITSSLLNPSQIIRPGMSGEANIQPPNG